MSLSDDVGMNMIFISYRKTDTQAVVDHLAESLKKHFGEGQVFKDTQDIRAGDHWPELLESKVRNCSVLLAVIGEQWLTTFDEDGRRRIDVEQDWVRQEICQAIAHKKRVIVLLVNSARLPSKAGLPKDCELQQLPDLQHMPIRSGGDWQADIKKLVEELAKQVPLGQNQDSIPLPTVQDFTAFLEEKRSRFCGRRWVFDDIDNWLRDSPLPAALIIGDPGMGKSALIAEFEQVHQARVVACHCCQATKIETLRPGPFVHSVAGMIARRLADYARLLAGDSLARWKSEQKCAEDPITAFHSMVIQPLKSLPAPATGLQLLLVDSLDEAIVLADSKTIVDLLRAALKYFPAWLRLIATTRNAPEILDSFPAYKSIRLTAGDDRNMADIDQYVSQRLQEPRLGERLFRSGASLHEVGDVLRAKSEGSFLYLRLALDGIESDRYECRHLDHQLPPDLNGLYLDWFRWQFHDDADYEPARKVLQAVVAACEPLSQDLLAQVTGLDDEDELPPVLSRLAAYLPQRDGKYAFYHQAMREWLISGKLRDHPAKPRFFIKQSRGHQQFAESGVRLFKNGSALLPEYFRRYLPVHLIETERWEDLRDVLSDLMLFEQAWRDGRKYEWMQHWQHLRGRCEPGAVYEAALQKLIDQAGETERISDLSDMAGCFLRDMGDNQSALPFMERALRLSERIFGRDHPETATRMHNLGELYRVTRQKDKALELLEEALRIRQLLFVGDHPDIATSYHKLGEFYHDLGQEHDDIRFYKAALDFYGKSQEIRERTLDEQHSDRGDCINDMGVVYMQLGERAAKAGQRVAAEQLFNRAVASFDQAKAIFDKAFGLENPDSATSELDIAMVCAKRKDYAAALDIGMKTLAVFRKTFARHHGKILIALEHLVVWQGESGNFSMAVELGQELLPLLAKAVGAEHERTENALLLLCGAQLASGQVHEALHSLRSHFKFGASPSASASASPAKDDRLTLARWQIMVASVCCRWGQVAKAIPFGEEALRLLEQSLGPKHLDVCVALDHLAKWYASADQNNKALGALQRMLSIRQAALDPKDFQIPATMLLLAKHYESTRQLDSARAEYLRMLECSEQTLAAGDFTQALQVVKEFFERTVCNADAARIGERILTIARQTPTTTERDLAVALNNLGFSYNRVGRHGEALALLEESLDLYRKVDEADTSSTLNNLAEAQLGLGNLDKATSYCQESLAFRENAKDPKRLAISQLTWSTILWKQSKLDKADESFRIALANHDRAGNAPCHYRLAGLKRYVEFLEQAGREQDAQRWRQRRDLELATLTGKTPS